MFGDLDKYIVPILTGFVVTYSLTPWVRALALRRGVVDVPSQRRQHTRPTARGGGVAVFLGTQAACFLALVVPWDSFAGGFSFQWWAHFAAASVILFIVGIIDDVVGVGPWIKLASQSLAGSVLFVSGSHVGAVFGYELPWFVDLIGTVFFLVAVINAFNLIDGLDGLAAGLAAISALGLCGFFVLARLPGYTLLLLGLIGACLAFLRYNFHPASVFLGDSGSMFLGLMLGAISLETFHKSTFLISVAIPLFVLGVPLFDTLLAVWRRSVRMLLPGPGPNGMKSGIMQADAEHLHHRLAESGLTTRRVATTMWAASGVLVLLSLAMMILKAQAAGIFMLALLAGAYVLTRQVMAIELRDTGKAALAGFRRPGREAIAGLAYPVWDVVWLAAAWQAALYLFPGAGRHDWDTWLLNLPIWVAPTFVLLALFQMYRVVWSRARVADVLLLLCALFFGLFASATLWLLLGKGEVKTTLLWALAVGVISHPGLLGARLLYRFVEELAPWLSSKRKAGGERERVVLYGAGRRCSFFLRERNFPDSQRTDEREIVGLIDDDPSLHSRLAHGYAVLGGRHDLPRLIREHRISGVVITAILSPDSRAAIEGLAHEHGLRLSLWQLQERDL